MRYAHAIEGLLAVLGAEKLLSTYQVIGTEGFRDIASEVIESEASVDSIAQFAKKLRKFAKSTDGHALGLWYTDHLEPMVDKRIKLEVGTVDSVITQAKSQKTPPSLALASRILPKLSPVAHTNGDMWKVLLGKLSEERESGRSPFGRDFLTRLIAQCLQQISLELPPRVLVKNPEKSWEEFPVTEHIVTFIELCVQFNAVAPAEAFFLCMQKEMLETHHSRPSYGLNVEPYRYYVDLVNEFKGMIDVTPGTSKYLSEFFAHALQAMLPCCRWQSTLPIDVALRYTVSPGTAIHDWLSQKDELRNTNTVDVAKRSLKILRQQGLPQEAIVQSFEVLTVHLEDKFKDLGGGVLITAGTMSDEVAYREALANAIDFFRLVGRLQSVSRLLEGILTSGAAGTGDNDFVCNTLVPVFQDLVSFLKSDNLSLADSPYSEFAVGAINKWLQHSEIPHMEVNCPCALCNQHLVPLLRDGPQRNFTIDVSERERNHLESRLKNIQQWGFNWRIQSGKLKVERPQSLMQGFKRMKSRPQKGQSLLEILGTPAERQKVLGSDYQRICGAIAALQSSESSAVGSTPSSSKSHPQKPKRPFKGANRAKGGGASDSKRQRLH
ncbi:hypothetical protein AAF712_008154 [Marasmius tenuissimus]|uniref:Uncharacterized protein n=1 Tax=Marasmius tenuissimus TaxID=585030 RepID=A0ABR2ZTJ7_9AGAR